MIKKTVCVLLVLNLGINSKALETQNNFLLQNKNNKLESKKDTETKINRVKQEIINNIDKKNIYKKNISRLEIDTYIPEIPKNETEINLVSSVINFSVNCAILGGVIFGIKSVINILWQRYTHGKHIKNSQDYKKIFEYLYEFKDFDPVGLKFNGITSRYSKDKKAKLYIINSNNYENKEIKIEDAPENVVIFCNGDKNINISKLSNKIKRLYIISKNCVKICNAPKIEFFYVSASSLVIKKNIESNEISQLKEAILNIQNLIIEEENKEYSCVIDSIELVKLIEKMGFLGGKKPDNIEYKTIKGLISNNGFGKNNWFTIYAAEK